MNRHAIKMLTFASVCLALNANVEANAQSLEVIGIDVPLTDVTTDNLSSGKEAAISPLKVFFVSVAGALVGYFALHRNTRLKAFIENPRSNWKIAAFDICVYLACAGLVALFLIEPEAAKEAFVAGLGWEGLIGGYVAGNEAKVKSAE